MNKIYIPLSYKKLQLSAYYSKILRNTIDSKDKYKSKSILMLNEIYYKLLANTILQTLK